MMRLVLSLPVSRRSNDVDFVTALEDSSLEIEPGEGLEFLV
jgi:hypothetical protein